MEKAKAAAAAVGGKVAVPREKGNGHSGVDFNDLHAKAGTSAVAKEVNAAAHLSDADVKSAVSELAKLPPIEQEQAIRQFAKALGIPRDAVRKEIRQLHAQTSPGNIILPSVVPWDETVTGEELLAEVIAAIRSHIIVSKHVAVAIGLWCVFSHAIDLFRINPRLVFMSPEPRCGKSRALETIYHLVQRGSLASTRQSDSHR